MPVNGLPDGSSRRSGSAREQPLAKGKIDGWIDSRSASRLTAIRYSQGSGLAPPAPIYSCDREASNSQSRICPIALVPSPR